jgi:hypothetical protein
MLNQTYLDQDIFHSAILLTSRDLNTTALRQVDIVDVRGAVVVWNLGTATAIDRIGITDVHGSRVVVCVGSFRVSLGLFALFPV